MRSHRKLLICSLAVWCGIASVGWGAKFNRKVNVGDAAPAWKDLAGTDGKSHGLADLKEAKAIVVVFTCNHCPVAAAYEERFAELVRDYGGKGVTLVAINCSRRPTDTLDKMKQRAESRKFPFDYLQDATQDIAKQYGATVTPHVFVLDAARKIAYMGAFDDNMEPSKVERKYVRDAIDAVLAGNRPEIRETRQFGCGIDYE